MIMDTDEMKSIEQGPGGSWVRELLAPWSWAASPSQCGWVHLRGSSPNPTLLGFFFFLTLKKNIYYLFIYLFLSVLGLSCSTRDLSLWCAGFSLAVARLSSCSTWTWLPCGMWGLRSPRDRTCIPCIGRRILTHRPTREVLLIGILWRLPPIGMINYSLRF